MLAVHRMRRFTIRAILLTALCGSIGAGFALAMRFLLPENAFNRNTEWIPHTGDRLRGYLSIALSGGRCLVPWHRFRRGWVTILCRLSAVYFLFSSLRYCLRFFSLPN